MTPEETVKRLREAELRAKKDSREEMLFVDAADIIERMSKALEEAEEFLAANKKMMHERGVVPFSRTELVLESIRATRE